MRKKIRNTGLVRIMMLLFLGAGAPNAGAGTDYVPFPGRIAVTPVRVETAKNVIVSFETWPGFSRNTTIELPGIAIPVDIPGADACERQRSVKALAFTRRFLAEAKAVYVQDMRMETSADSVVYSDLISDRGSLIRALETEGLARPAKVPPRLSWCK
ncbi:MAG: hypothetical protein GC138_05285 [Gammaproteobacteria bacterium]|nr:hypothetical protein [Gammaproteobacteria bacterium]